MNWIHCVQHLINDRIAVWFINGASRISIQTFSGKTYYKADKSCPYIYLKIKLVRVYLTQRLPVYLYIRIVRRFKIYRLSTVYHLNYRYSSENVKGVNLLTSSEQLYYHRTLLAQCIHKILQASYNSIFSLTEFSTYVHNTLIVKC